jgi:hypothetical protein
MIVPALTYSCRAWALTKKQKVEIAGMKVLINVGLYTLKGKSWMQGLERN